MALSLNAALQTAIASAANQVAVGAAIVSALGSTGVRFRCKRDANAAAADPWSTGTEFLNAEMSAPLIADRDTGAITLGSLSNCTVKAAADLSTGASVWRIESGSYAIQGTLGLTGSGSDLMLSASPTAATGINTFGAAIKPPVSLPINGNLIAVGGTLTTVGFENTSGAQIANQPVKFGQVFKRSALPSGSGVRLVNGGTVLPAQMDVKTSWPDGSVCHAIISAIVPSIQPNTISTFNIERIAEPAAGTATVPADFSGLDAVVSIVEDGTTYTASIATMLAGTYETWFAGPIAGSWMAQVPLKTSGNVTHPDLEVRFEVTAFKGQAKAHIAAIIEHCKVTAGNSSAKTVHHYDLTITVGGEQVYTKSAIVHLFSNRLIRRYWWGGAPVVHVRQNSTYVIGTKAVPNFDPVAIGYNDPDYFSLIKSRVFDNSDVFKNGWWVKDMGTTGGRVEIGLMPAYEAVWLNTMDERVKDAMIMQNDLMGGWDAHRRDTATGKPYCASNYSNNVLPTHEAYAITGVSNSNPAVVTAAGHKFKTGMRVRITGVVGAVVNGTTTLNVNSPYTIGVTTANTFELFIEESSTGSLTPVDTSAQTAYSSGGSAQLLNRNIVDLSHCPAVGYLAYLLTGDHYHLESLLFYNHNAHKLLSEELQVRAQAWGVRFLAQCAFITPDAHPSKVRYTAMVDSNFNDYNTKYTYNPNANELGVLPGVNNGTVGWADESSTGFNVQRTWQDDFLTAALGYAIDLGFAQAKPFFRWKTKYVVSRMNYCRMLACAYNFKLRDSTSSPLYTTIEEVFKKTFDPYTMAQPFNGAAMAAAMDTHAVPPNPVREIVVANSMSGNPSSSSGYVANMQPALAYAVTHQAKGAAAAWASYEQRAVKADYSREAQFGIVPRSE